MTANDDKRMQLINSIEPYAYGRNKEIIHKKEEITCIGITKHYSTIKNVTIMMLQKKTYTNISQIGHEFIIIHTEY